MVDEATRQRIKYLVEHGGVISTDPPISPQFVRITAAVIVCLQLVDIGVHLLR